MINNILGRSRRQARSEKQCWMEVSQLFLSETLVRGNYLLETIRIEPAEERKPGRILDFYTDLKLLLPTLGVKGALSPRKLSKFKHRQLPPNRVKHENNSSKILEDINDT